ncbi:delta(14)-sterol reductase TM7SF2-like isoform X2 [Ornithodoros turicata]|uniref:delta(14)-sterol reductase TM7SF2-like isoform X2 n=1 Tax=Ornithodoros turicata TaxID=34597 RepID=UPI00313A32C9
MAREESKTRGRRTQSSSRSRKASRSTSRGRQPKAAKSPPSPVKKAKSPERKSSPARKAVSPARPATPAKKAVSPGRPATSGKKAASSTRVQSPTKKAASPVRAKSPAKKTTSPKPRARSPARKKPSSPARGRSATRKGASPTRGRSPAAKKTPDRPKSPTKKAARPQSKSPSRARTPVIVTSVVDARARGDASVKDSPAVSVSKPTPNAVVSPMAVRQRSSLLSGTPLNSVGKREGLFEGTATVFEKKGTISFTDVPSGSLRMSARIASMQASKEEEEEVAEKEKQTTSEAQGPSKMWSVLQRVNSFGWVPTITALLWLVLIPTVLIGSYLLCGKGQCSISTLPTLPKTLNSYLHWKIAIGYGIFFLLQALLQAIPVGRTVYGFPCKLFKQHVAYRYRLNGWLNLTGTVVVCVALTHYGFPSTVVYRFCFQTLLTALAASVVLSVVFYIKGHFAPKNHRNPAGNTGNVLNDFVVGREIAPRVGEMYDLSVLLFRTGFMSLAVLLGSMTWYEYLQQRGLNYNFAISAFCGLLYVLLYVLDEEYFLGSVFITEDGLGYFSTAGNLAALPFVFAFPAKFLLEHKQVLPIYCLPGIVILFLAGLALIHFSNKRKYCFRRNWPDPTARGQGLDYLTDKSGNRLLVSGTWGFVRHPNYLGDLLCTLALALPCGFKHVLPFYGLLATAIFLVVRTYEVERKCRERYGDLWRKYTERVKYRIVPYVF